MRRRAVTFMCLFAMSVAASAGASAARAGGFDRAVDALSTRVVRLFGLKAGLSVGYGSGVMVSDDGLVVTVVSLLLDAENLRVLTADGTAYGAEVVGRDEQTQLALLRLTPLARYDRHGNRVEGVSVEAGRFDYFRPADSRALRPGDWVVAGGNPFKVATGDEAVSVSAGVFSARTELDARRKTRDFPYRGEVLVIDSVTSTPGSPGGALVNLDGAWVGLIGRLVISNRTRTNLNYAIPVEIVSAFIASVLDPGSERSISIAKPVAAGFHGIKLMNRGYQKKLPYVARVRRRSPARKAGIRKDDLIVTVAGRSIGDIDAFDEIMSWKRPGDEVAVVVIRDDKLRSFRLVLEEPR